LIYDQLIKHVKVTPNRSFIYHYDKNLIVEYVRYSEQFIIF